MVRQYGALRWGVVGLVVVGFACGRLEFQSLAKEQAPQVDGSLFGDDTAVRDDAASSDSSTSDSGGNDSAEPSDAAGVDSGMTDGSVADTSDCVVPIGCTRVECGGSSCAWFCPDGLNAIDAANRCAESGARLACPNDLADHECIVSMLPAGADVWIGATQDASATGLDQGWTCPDGSAFSSWRDDSPNDTGVTPNIEDHEQDCAFVNVDFAAWVDAQCTEVWPFLCER